MTRVEKNAGVEKQLDEVKAEVTSEVRRRTRKARPWLTCSLAILLVLVGVCVWGLWTVAATGLVPIPIFTSLAYKTPLPTRPVTAGVLVETVLGEEFTSTLTRRLYEGNGALTNRSIDILLDEQSLTASVRSFLEQADLTWIDASHVQIVVDPSVGVELFVPFSGNELGTAATIVLDLGVQEGNLIVTPTKIQVGSALVPDFLIAVLLKPLLEAQLAKLNEVMVGYAKISTIEILPRELLISGELSVEVVQ